MSFREFSRIHLLQGVPEYIISQSVFRKRVCTLCALVVVLFLKVVFWEQRKIVKLKYSNVKRIYGNISRYLEEVKSFETLQIQFVNLPLNEKPDET